MRVVFAGTPAVAVPSLAMLVDSSHDVVAVISRPDRAKGRGRRVEASPVSEYAREHDLPLHQPVSAREPAFREQLVELKPDVCAVVAYGALLPSEALSVPPMGWINLHFSLLPQWRGAAPVQRAIWHGDQISGATTFRLDDGMDTGPVFGIVTDEIGPTDTSGTLLDRLAVSGAGLLLATLDGIETGQLVAVPQSHDGVSMAPKLTVEEARIDWNLPAHIVDRRIRACTPAPGAWTELAGVRLRVLPVTPTKSDVDIAAGQLVVEGKRLLAGTATDPVQLGEVVPAGKRQMPALDWWRGLRLADGATFG